MRYQPLPALGMRETALTQLDEPLEVAGVLPKDDCNQLSINLAHVPDEVLDLGAYSLSRLRNGRERLLRLLLCVCRPTKGEQGYEYDNESLHEASPFMNVSEVSIW